MKKYFSTILLAVLITVGVFLSANVVFAEDKSIIGNLDASCRENGDCTLNDLMYLIVVSYKGTMFVIGSMVMLWFVLGGITFITSAGNSDKIKKGKDMLIGSVAGLILVLSSYLLVQFTLQTLGVVDENGNFANQEFRASWQQPDTKVK